MSLKTVYILVFFAFCATAQSVKQSRLDDLGDKSSDISRVKTEHYRLIGFMVLPAFFTDSIVGPGKYVGIEDATIRKGTSLQIRPGTTLMFEAGKKLVVEGRLVAHSNSSFPITLSNVPLNVRYFKVVNPDSLWGGIEAKAGSIIELSDITISCSICGISGAEKPESLRVKCLNVSRQVTVPVSLPDIIQYSTSNLSCLDVQYPSLAASAKPITSKQTPVKNYKSRHIGLKIGFGSLTIAGAGLAGYGIYQYVKNDRLYENSKEPGKNTPSEVAKYERDGRQSIAMEIIGLSLAAIGTTGLILTFRF